MEEDSSRNKLISFGLLTYKTFYPFIVAVFYILKNYCYTHLNSRDTDLIWTKNPLFFTLLLFFGEALNGVFYCISFFLNRSKARLVEAQQCKLATMKIYSIAFEKNTNRVVYFYFFVSALLSFLTTSVINIMTNSYDRARDLSFEMRIFNLFFIALLSYWILKYPIHRHQFLAFVFVVIGIFIGFTTRFIKEGGIDFEYVLIYLATYFVFSLREVFEKWLLEKEKQMPMKIIFYQGIMGIGINLVALPIYNALVDGSLPVHTLIALMFSDGATSLLFIAHIVFCTFYMFFAIYTKYYFSPTVMPIAYSFALVLWRLLFINSVTFDLSEAFAILGYLILLFGCLVFNEILILYCCRLAVNTKMEISRRSSFELQLYSDSNKATEDV